jgi:uracil-DNA glycosylase
MSGSCAQTRSFHDRGIAASALDDMVRRIRACRICRDTPNESQLPHEPRPVLQVSATARIAICGQAPGTRVHASGRPFTDPSGDRLRVWTGLSSDVFYDASRIAIVPMGFCFPGLSANGSDLPPRRECATTWHGDLFAALPTLKLVLLIGGYAQRWHLGTNPRDGVTATVARWREFADTSRPVIYFPLPHPSWRNSGWLKRQPWFEREALPVLRGLIARELTFSASP